MDVSVCVCVCACVCVCVCVCVILCCFHMHSTSVSAESWSGWILFQGKSYACISMSFISFPPLNLHTLTPLFNTTSTSFISCPVDHQSEGVPSHVTQKLIQISMATETNLSNGCPATITLYFTN